MILIVLFVTRKAMFKYDTKSGYKIVILVTWILFVMINAYFRFVGQCGFIEIVFYCNICLFVCFCGRPLSKELDIPIGI